MITDKQTHQPRFGICVRQHKEIACRRMLGRGSCHAHRIQRLKLVRDRFSNAEGHQRVLSFPFFFFFFKIRRTFKSRKNGWHVDRHK